MPQIIFSQRFNKAIKRLKGSGSFSDVELEKILRLLEAGLPLEHKHRDHQLNGKFFGYRDCHVYSDVVLIYKVNKALGTITLTNIGSHSDLFG